MNADLYSEEAEADLIAVSRKLALEEIKAEAALLRADDHYEFTQYCLECHRERVAKIKRLFLRMRTPESFRSNEPGDVSESPVSMPAPMTISQNHLPFRN